jgi:hypothetical protein
MAAIKTLVQLAFCPKKILVKDTLVQGSLEHFTITHL